MHDTPLVTTWQTTVSKRIKGGQKGEEEKREGALPIEASKGEGMKKGGRKWGH